MKTAFKVTMWLWLILIVGVLWILTKPIAWINNKLEDWSEKLINHFLMED